MFPTNWLPDLIFGNEKSVLTAIRSSTLHGFEPVAEDDDRAVLPCGGRLDFVRLSCTHLSSNLEIIFTL